MKVSIVTITYNHSKYISQAIESFLMQKTDFEFEVIIADDASTDNNQDIIREYQKKNPEIIKPILRKENIGINNNFADAVNRCKGKYIALCEGDDYWTDLLKLQKQVEFLEANEDYGLVYSDIDVIDSENRIINNSAFYTRISKRFTSGDIFESLLIGNFLTSPSVCIKKEIIDNYFLQFNNETFLIDYRLWLHAATKFKVKYIDEKLSVYRDHSEGISKKNGYFDERMPLIRQSAIIYHYGFEKRKVDSQLVIGEVVFGILYNRRLSIWKKMPIIKFLVTKPRILSSVIYFLYKNIISN